MSLKNLLDELFKKLQEIPTVDLGEVIEPEHHNLLREAVSLLYQIVYQLSQTYTLTSWIIVWPSFRINSQYRDIQILRYPPYSSEYYDDNRATFPLPVILKNFRVWINVNENTGPGYVSIVKNEGQAKITITIPAETTGWFENTADTLVLDEGDTLYLETDGSQAPSGYDCLGWGYVYVFPKLQ
ncbi:MAG: hypothetical protein QW290_08585 [Sulfolobales archaeon]